MRKATWRVEARGDSALALVAKGTFSLAQHDQLLALLAHIDAAKPAEVLDVVPGHSEILLQFHPGTTNASRLATWLKQIARQGPGSRSAQSSSLVRVPVCFDADFGLDLPAVATQLSLTQAEVVEAFTAPVYTCTVVGFRPGFPYLEGVPQKLLVPRHGSPRACVPRGSVAIAAGQAGIYPVDGPGGWRILGRTNVRLFAPTNTHPCLIGPGTRVQFYAVNRNTLAEGVT